MSHAVATIPITTHPNAPSEVATPTDAASRAMVVSSQATPRGTKVSEVPTSSAVNAAARRVAANPGQPADSTGGIRCKQQPCVGSCSGLAQWLCRPSCFRAESKWGASIVPQAANEISKSASWPPASHSPRRSRCRRYVLSGSRWSVCITRHGSKVVQWLKSCGRRLHRPKDLTLIFGVGPC